MAQAPETAPPSPPTSIQVVNGYLLVHLPNEAVTVVGQPMAEGSVDTGWATWGQRGQLLWRGEMKDSQGRLYNVRILPGYVAPWHFAMDGWADAGQNLTEYGKAETWTTMGHHMRDTFKWGWKTAFWEFGMKGTQEAWRDNLEKARARTARKTFGWPLAYPWAFVASAFESVLRVPLGTAGGVLGTVGAGVVIPVVETAWPTLKAVGNISVNGVALPMAAWVWQTVAAPPGALLASAPTPARADGTWMKLMEPTTPAHETPREGSVPEPVMADLTRYVIQTAALDKDAATSLVDLERRERAEIASVHARFEAASKAVQEARTQKLQAWANLPENRDALLRLAKEGGDAKTIRAAKVVLVQRLMAAAFTEADAKAIVDRLASHPLSSAARDRAPGYDKTDPLRGALDTVKHVDQEAGKAGL
jgi:hypothetical protein